jgi:hypothetical protein
MLCAWSIRRFILFGLLVNQFDTALPIGMVAVEFAAWDQFALAQCGENAWHNSTVPVVAHAENGEHFVNRPADWRVSAKRVVVHDCSFAGYFCLALTVSPDRSLPSKSIQ